MPAPPSGNVAAAGQDPVRTERLPSFASHGDNNLDAQLLGLEVDAADQIIPGLFDEDDLPSVKKQVAYTFLVALPPLLIAAVAHDVQIVRTITGAYPGLTVMFFIPCALVYVPAPRWLVLCARRLAYVRRLAPCAAGFSRAAPCAHALWRQRTPRLISSARLSVAT